MEKVAALFRAIYRAFVVAMLCFIIDEKAVYGFPLGIIIGMLSEAETLTKK